MFGRKKKKNVVQSNKPKLSDYPPEVQAKLLARLEKMGDDMTARYERIMNKRLERERARLLNNTNGSQLNADVVPETGINSSIIDRDDR